MHTLKIPMVNFEKLVALNLYLCYYASVLFWQKGVCQIYVSTSLLGPAEGEALISALKLVWVIFPEPLQALVLIIWPNLRMPWRWCETNMLARNLARRVGKSKQTNESKPNQNKAKQTNIDLETLLQIRFLRQSAFHPKSFLKPNLDLVIIVQSLRMSQALASPDIMKSIRSGATSLEHSC